MIDVEFEDRIVYIDKDSLCQLQVSSSFSMKNCRSRSPGFVYLTRKYLDIISTSHTVFYGLRLFQLHKFVR